VSEGQVADLWRVGDAHAMSDDHPQQLTIEVGKSASVSALLTRPQRARACFVFAHGAGAGMSHPFMAAVATGLAERDIATLAISFPTWKRVQSGITVLN
jgi:hypothetical protein